MTKIYWAAPLHEEKDRERNAKYVEQLRAAGFKVYVPQEHGVWEDLVDKLGTREQVRRYLFELDLKAMQECDMCIACCGNLEDPRGPSEGMLWEMGWCTAAHKAVYLFNEDNYWSYNLMPEYGASRIFSDFDELLTYISSQRFV